MPNNQLVSEFLLANVGQRNLISTEVNPTNIVATFQFDNSADYTANVWPLEPFVVDLHAAGVTRSYTYSLVTGT
jgi:hypothetical protein